MRGGVRYKNIMKISFLQKDEKMAFSKREIFSTDNHFLIFAKLVTLLSHVKTSKNYIFYKWQDFTGR
jgi:hypothetical protein